LDDVVVSSKLECANDVALLGPRRHDDDGNHRDVPNPAADLESVGPGEVKLQQNHVRRLRLKPLERLRSVTGPHDPMTLTPQAVGHDIPEIHIGFNDKYL